MFSVYIHMHSEIWTKRYSTILSGKSPEENQRAVLWLKAVVLKKHI